jgi:hypothetical protein
MCPLCISIATWFVGTTLLPAALAEVFVKVPRSSPPLQRRKPAPAHPSASPANTLTERK